MLASLYEALGRRDLAAVGALIDPEAFALVGGSNALSGLREGGDEVLALYGKVLEQASESLELDVHDILANDDHGLAIVRVTGEGGGRSYDEYETHVYELVEGKVAGLFVYWNDPAPADAFYAAP